MNKTESLIEGYREYPITKAREILERDGTFLPDDELERIVKVLSLMASQENELINQKKAA